MTTNSSIESIRDALYKMRWKRHSRWLKRHVFPLPRKPPMYIHHTREPDPHRWWAFVRAKAGERGPEGKMTWMERARFAERAIERAEKALLLKGHSKDCALNLFWGDGKCECRTRKLRDLFEDGRFVVPSTGSRIVEELERYPVGKGQPLDHPIELLNLVTALRDRDVDVKVVPSSPGADTYDVTIDRIVNLDVSYELAKRILTENPWGR